MIGIETIEAAGGWRDRIADPSALAALCHSAASAAEPRLAGEIALLLTDDNAMRDLNERFRGQAAPTNVLSFPSGEARPGFLGDIALSYETCVREAAEKGVRLHHHAAHLIVHGLLHLVGYDHERSDEAQVMEALETRILATMGIADPYRENARAD